MATKGKTKKPTARREAADETTSSERLTALVEESDALARIVAKNPSAPVSLLRVLSRSEDGTASAGEVICGKDWISFEPLGHEGLKAASAKSRA